MPKKICVFGDSIAWGGNDFENGGWVCRLKNYFAATGQSNEVFNLSNPGESTNELLKRIRVEIQFRIKPKNFKRDVTIIMIGVNDSQSISNKKEYRVLPNKFKNNFKKIIKITQKITKKVVVIGLFQVEEKKVSPSPWEPNMSYTNKNIIKYNDIIKSTCAENDVFFINIINLLKNKDLDDGLHPNAAGHKKIFEKVKNYLIENEEI